MYPYLARPEANRWSRMKANKEEVMREKAAGINKTIRCSYRPQANSIYPAIHPVIPRVKRWVGKSKKKK